MTIEVTFPGGVAVDARVGDHHVHTDQPESAGGAGSGPSPFDLFLASIATCAGFYALRFCQQRELPTEGLSVRLESERDPDRGRVATLRTVVTVPDGFPDKYRQALERAVDQCTVKRHVVEAPEFETVVETGNES